MKSPAKLLLVVAACLLGTLLMLRVGAPNLLVGNKTVFYLNMAAWFCFFGALAEWKTKGMGFQSILVLVLLSAGVATLLFDVSQQHFFDGLTSPPGALGAVWMFCFMLFWRSAFAEKKNIDEKPQHASAADTEFLADPNEDEEAAEYYLRKFRSEGIVEGNFLHLVVTVSKIPEKKVVAVSKKVRELYDCDRLEMHRSRLFVRKSTLTAFLKPVPFNKTNLLTASRALYRLILDYGVTVEIERA